MNNNKKEMHNDKYILDACCGSRMFWFDKSNKNTVFMDNRTLEDTLCDGRTLSVHPDVIGDFRNIPFDDNTFKLVVFDPPHLIHAGENIDYKPLFGDKRGKTRWTVFMKEKENDC